jgi:hypothetical protein
VAGLKDEFFAAEEPFRVSMIATKRHKITK